VGSLIVSSWPKIGRRVLDHVNARDRGPTRGELPDAERKTVPAPVANGEKHGTTGGRFGQALKRKWRTDKGKKGTDVPAGRMMVQTNASSTSKHNKKGSGAHD